MGFRYIVFGATKQGLVIVEDLIQRCDAVHVTIIDGDRAALANARSMLDCDIQTLFLLHSVTELTREHDVAICCSEAEDHLQVTHDCLQAKTPMVDLTPAPEIVDQQKAIVEDNQACLVISSEFEDHLQAAMTIYYLAQNKQQLHSGFFQDNSIIEQQWLQDHHKKFV